MTVLSVSDLRKTFVRGMIPGLTRRRTEALRGISLDVEAGEIFGFLGPNGAGKTTTIKILMGLIFPSGGRATLLGAPAGDRRAKARIGYLPENPYFYDYLSVLELLDMVGRLFGQAGAERKRRAAQLVERVGLTHAARRPLRSYSKGMLQRAGLAQALMGDPDLVVLDEPLSGLDPLGRKEVRDLIFELKAQGKTIFFCTHILADAAALCDRVGIIVKGKLRDVGPLGELLSPRVHSVDVVWQPAAADGDDESGEDRERAAAELDAMAEKFTTRRGAHGHTTVVPDPDEADRFVATLSRTGGKLLSLVPHRQTLEELFVHEAEAVDRGGEEGEG